MGKKPNYKWIDGYPAKVAADVAGSELKKLREKHDGQVTPQLVVDSARPENAPLHPAFEWNDYEAAEAYRRHQAKGIIRAIVTVSPATKEETREYVGIRGAEVDKTKRETTVYVTTRAAVSDPGMFAQAVSRLEAHVQRARASLEELKRAAQEEGIEPERLARIALAATAIEAASAAVSGLH
jgi:hypothetical protein